MSISERDVVALARELDEAERTRSQIPLISQRFPDATLEDAYAIQDAWTRSKIARGRRKIGWKVGLTSRAMQKALEIDTPDSGILFDDMAFKDGQSVPEDRFIQPRVEAEIAFVLKSPLRGDALTVSDVLAATDFVVPSLEILDTRIIRRDRETGRARTIVDTVADNAANGGLVMGARPVRATEVDLRWVGAIVSRNDVIEETGLGAGVLGHPAMGIVWLAARLAQLGIDLEAGDIVLSGSFIRPLETDHGDRIVADFGDFGTVSIAFA